MSDMDRMDRGGHLLAPKHTAADVDEVKSYLRTKERQRGFLEEDSPNNLRLYAYPMIALIRLSWGLSTLAHV